MSELNNPPEPMSRRALMRVAGSTVAAGGALKGAVAKSPAKSAPGEQRVPARSPVEWLKGRASRGGDASALAGAPTGGQHRLTSLINPEEGIKVAKLNKQIGWSVQIKPTGYRGIPIYTVHNLSLSLDSRAIDPETIVFVYNNTAYKPGGLKDLIGMQWWVFDWATLFVPGPISPGEHEVEVRFEYANTYFKGTASNGAKVRLRLSDQMDYLCL